MKPGEIHPGIDPQHRRKSGVRPEMGPLESKARFSLQVTPEASIHGKFQAELQAKQIVLGIPCEPALKLAIPPTGLRPTLERLGLCDEHMASVLSRFGHEQAITLTLDMDRETMASLGFAPCSKAEN